ncbi:MAG: hypothetical protein GXX79_13615 [Actinomycetales bacterium]|nr:hypothetical protein [Actinomycetales bacterium]
MNLTERSQLPSRHAVRTTIEDLVNRPVKMEDSDILPVRDTSVLAVYVNDRIVTSAVIVLDLAAAARIGGALGMVPPGAVDDAIAEFELTEMLTDCCREVLNVLASVFNVRAAPHVRLYAMYGPGDVIPGDLTALAVVPGERLDVTLSVHGYGEGRLSVVVR